jgi:histidinol-phosphate aminotransferase
MPSQTNFVLAKPPEFAAKHWLEKLRARRILVRWFDQTDLRNYLRISIGTRTQAEALVRAAQDILRQS